MKKFSYESLDWNQTCYTYYSKPLRKSLNIILNTNENKLALYFDGNCFSLK